MRFLCFVLGEELSSALSNGHRHASKRWHVNISHCQHTFQLWSFSRASKRQIQPGGGASYRLPKEEDCKVIVNVKLPYLKRNIMSPFLLGMITASFTTPTPTRWMTPLTVKTLRRASWHFPSYFQGTHFKCGRSPVCINSVAITENARKCMISS